MQSVANRTLGYIKQSLNNFTNKLTTIIKINLYSVQSNNSLQTQYPN